MSLSRFRFFFSKQRSTEAIRLLQRFGPSKRFQCRNYAESTNHYRKSKNQSVMYAETPASRSWTPYILLPALLGFTGLAVFVRYNDERRAVPKGQGNCSQGTAAKGPAIGGPFSLIDTEGLPVTERSFLGNWVLLYFGYTSSPDIGPEQLQVVAKAVDTLESIYSSKVLPVFVTIDPQRDSPSLLRAYLEEVDPRIVGLTGSVSAIKQMAQEYRIFFKKVEEEGNDYLVESSHNMYLLNPNMEIVRCFGTEYNAEQLSKAILQELKRTSM